MSLCGRFLKNKLNLFEDHSQHSILLIQQNAQQFKVAAASHVDPLMLTMLLGGMLQCCKCGLCKQFSSACQAKLKAESAQPHHLLQLLAKLKSAKSETD